MNNIIKSYNDYDIPVNETVDELLNEEIKSNYPWISVNDSLPDKDDDIFVSMKSDISGERYYACWKGYILLYEVDRNENPIDYWMLIPKID